MKTRPIMTVVSAALSFLLPGCLVSNTPLITAANSDRPLPAHVSVRPKGKSGKAGSIDLAGDNSYVFTDGTENVSLYFKKIADNLYAVSAPMNATEAGVLRGYQYGYIRVAADGSKIAVQWPHCDEFEAAKIEKMGVKTEKEEGEPRKCHIPSVDVLVTLLSNYIDDPKNAESIKAREKDSTFNITTK